MSRLLTALVIGNAAYDGGSRLKNPCNDADDVAARLEASGFEVVKMIDCSNADLDRALRRFKRARVGNDVGLFFCAGHGMQIDWPVGPGKHMSTAKSLASYHQPLDVLCLQHSLRTARAVSQCR